jgi:hypothetical protein
MRRSMSERAIGGKDEEEKKLFHVSLKLLLGVFELVITF